MSKNLSAVKKHRVSLRNAYRNKVYKSIIKTKVKRYLVNLQLSNDTKYLASLLSDVYQVMDKAVKKGVLHKNKAARKKSCLYKKLKII